MLKQDQLEEATQPSSPGLGLMPALLAAWHGQHPSHPGDEVKSLCLPPGEGGRGGEGATSPGP